LLRRDVWVGYAKFHAWTGEIAMRWGSLFVAAASAAFLAVAGVHGRIIESAAAQSNATTLLGIDALAAVIGNTLTAGPDRHAAIFLDRNGIAKMVGQDGTVRATRWMSAGGGLCFPLQGGSGWDCSLLTVSGTTATLSGARNSSSQFTIQSGEVLPVAGSANAPLTGFAAMQAITGGTLDASYGTRLYFKTDGGIEIAQKDNNNTPARLGWAFTGDRLCLSRESRNTEWHLNGATGIALPECFLLSITGKKATLTDDRAYSGDFTLCPGNRVKTGCPGADTLTGAEALEVLLGNTLVYEPGGNQAVALFLRRDGTAMSLQAGKPSTLRWSFDHGRLCLTKEGSSDPECFLLEVTGKSASLGAKNDVIGPMTILPGNARDLN
jgi:hypothetical protein